MPQAKGSGKGEQGSGVGWLAERGGRRLLVFWRVQLCSGDGEMASKR